MKPRLLCGVAYHFCLCDGNDRLRVIERRHNITECYQ